MLDRKNGDTQINLVPNEVQGDFILSSNSVSSPCTSLGGNYSEFIELGKVFKGIHLRLLSLGYKLENGRFVKPYENKKTNS